MASLHIMYTYAKVCTREDKTALPYGNGNVEHTLNKRNLRRRRKFDVEYTLILRWKMVIRWTYTFQRRIHVDSTSTSTLRLVRIFLRRFDVDSTSKRICADMVYFSTSNQRRFYVEKYPCKHCVFFNVDSTLKFPSTRTVDSSTSNISRFHIDASPTVFVDFSTLNTSGTLRSPMMSLLPSLALNTSRANWKNRAWSRPILPCPSPHWLHMNGL